MSASSDGALVAHSAYRRPSICLLSAMLKTRRSEEHTSELQSQSNLVCRLLLETNATSSPTARAIRTPSYSRPTLAITSVTRGPRAPHLRSTLSTRAPLATDGRDAMGSMEGYLR